MSELSTFDRRRRHLPILDRNLRRYAIFRDFRIPLSLQETTEGVRCKILSSYFIKPPIPTIFKAW